MRLPAGSILLERALTVAAAAPMTVQQKASVMATAEGRLSVAQTNRVRQAVINNTPPQQRGIVVSAVSQTANPAVEEESSPA